MMRRLSLLIVFLLLLPASLLRAEKVADLPLPTSYVNDFASVLNPATRQTLDDLCVQLHQKANAEIAVVTINTLDDDQTIEEFTGALEEKWKFGKKGSDRSAIYVLVVKSRKVRLEVGYGLEGILPDAKVGRILDQALPFEQQDDWNDAAKTAVNGVAQVIAADAQVTLTPIVHRYHREGEPNARNQGFSLGQIILGVIFLGVIATLILTGNGGWALMLIWSLMGSGGGGGGGGGGGRDDDNGGGGFGGMGGGSSGGGGASRDF